MHEAPIKNWTLDDKGPRNAISRAMPEEMVTRVSCSHETQAVVNTGIGENSARGGSRRAQHNVLAVGEMRNLMPLCGIALFSCEISGLK